METYYIIDDGGYKICVKGRAVQVHRMFKTFYHLKNNNYIVLCQESGIVFGSGDTLSEAKETARRWIKNCGIACVQHKIKMAVKFYGPEPGGGK